MAESGYIYTSIRYWTGEIVGSSIVEDTCSLKCKTGVNLARLVQAGKELENLFR